MVRQARPLATPVADTDEGSDAQVIQALPMLMELTPTEHDRARVTGIIAHDALVGRALVEAVHRVRRLVPDARIELVSHPESELDLPLTLEARLPRPYMEFRALRQDLSQWWIERHPHARKIVLFAVFPGGTA